MVDNTNAEEMEEGEAEEMMDQSIDDLFHISEMNKPMA